MPFQVANIGAAKSDINEETNNKNRIPLSLKGHSSQRFLYFFFFFLCLRKREEWKSKFKQVNGKDKAIYYLFNYHFKEVHFIKLFKAVLS